MDYGRQNMEYDQDKFTKTKVTVIGAGPVANHLCAYMAGFGIGNIKILDDSKIGDNEKEFQNEFLFTEEERGKDKGEVLVDKLKKINEDIKARYLKSPIDKAFIGSPHILIDATNDSNSKKLSRKLANELNLSGESDIELMISASSDDHSSSIVTYKPSRKLTKEQRIAGMVNRKRRETRVASLLGVRVIDDFVLERYNGKTQGSFTSSIMGALCVDEIRKARHPFFDIVKDEHGNEKRNNRDYPLEKRVSYDLLSPKRFYIGDLKRQNPRIAKMLTGTEVKSPKLSQDLFKDKKALVVGVGGTGTYTVLNLAMLGFGQIDIYDGDVIEEHNRPRQIFYFDAVGKNKAEVLAERLGNVNSKSNIVPHGLYVDDNVAKSFGDYDVIFDCTDTLEPKIVLSRFASEKKRPLFSGGVTLYTASSESYVPGQNRCYGCRHGFEPVVQTGMGRGCTQNVIAPNVLVAGFNVGEAIALMFPENYTAIYDRKLQFTSRTPDSMKVVQLPVEYISENECKIRCTEG